MSLIQRIDSSRGLDMLCNIIGRLLSMSFSVAEVSQTCILYYLNPASLTRQRYNVQPKGLRRKNSVGFGIGSPNRKYHYITRTSKSMYTHRKLNQTSFEAVHEGGAGHACRGFADNEKAQLSCPVGSGFCLETGFNPYLVASRVQP